jgi:type IV secretion system protein VirD4
VLPGCHWWSHTTSASDKPPLRTAFREPKRKDNAMKLTRLILIIDVLGVAYCALMLAILIPWGWVAIPLGLLAVLYKKRHSWSAFGTARWATIRDLRGMLDSGNGLLIGQVEVTPGLIAGTKALFDSTVPADIACEQFLRTSGKPPPRVVRLNRAVHTAAFIPTGGGKGVSLVIPHLLSCPDSMIVLDYKGENARITAKARRKMGHKIVMLDPFKSVTQTPDTLNPLDFIDTDSSLVLDEIRALANALVIRTGQEKEPHWNDSAEIWITAMIAVVVAFAEPKERSLQTVRTLLTDPKKMEAAIKLMCESEVWDGLLCRLGGQLSQYKDKELSSCLTTVNRHLRFLDTPAIFESTKTSSFDPADLVRKKLTDYLIIPPEHMSANTALLRMWNVSLLRAVVRGGLQEKHKVHFILDEAASLGHMDVIDDAVDKFRGYGVRLFFLFQSLGQLKKCFPEGQEQTLLSNVTQIFAGVNDNETAKYVSERLGKETIIVESGGTSSSTSRSHSEEGKTSWSYSNSRNDNWAQNGRELLQSSEVMNLHERLAITFTPGVPPICTWLIRYYESSSRKLSDKWWFTITAFIGAVLCFFIIGFFCVLVTEGVREKYQMGDFPAVREQWQQK